MFQNPFDTALLCPDACMNSVSGGPLELSSYMARLKTDPPSHSLLVISGYASETAEYSQSLSEHLYLIL